MCINKILSGASKKVKMEGTLEKPYISPGFCGDSTDGNLLSVGVIDGKYIRLKLSILLKEQG
jgi:hypothetical protein